MIDDVLSHKEIKQTNSSIPAFQSNEKIGSIRNIEKKSTTINALVSSEKILTIVRQVLGNKPRFVRAILFNKTIENNWAVSWHQDKTVAVTQKFKCKGWKSWSVKDGVNHVQPPIEVLEQMVTCRLHLDNVSQENGCLKVIPNSHQHGILNHVEIQQYVAESSVKACETLAGSMLMMRPHILHSSNKAAVPTQRRVLHMEYCGFPLPEGINWT